MPGKAKSGRGSVPLRENQCHVAGFTSPLGSQNDVAGTRQRRSSNEPSQNLLVRILSSRTLVTRLGARPSCSSRKPQLIATSWRSPSSSLAHDRRNVGWEDRGQWLIGRGAIVRHAEQARDHVPALVQAIEVAHRLSPCRLAPSPH